MFDYDYFSEIMSKYIGGLKIYDVSICIVIDKCTCIYNTTTK